MYKEALKDLSETIAPKSDRINVDQLIAGDMILNITEVEKVTENDQPSFILYYEGHNGRPFRPCLSMRRVIIAIWGKDGNNYVGKKLQIYNDPTVTYGKDVTGGVRISHMSDLPSDKDSAKVKVTVRRNKKEEFIIKRLNAKPAIVKPVITESDITSAREQLSTAAPFGMQTLQKCWAGLSAEIRTALGGSCPQEYKDIANAPPPVEDVPAATDNDGEMF